MFKKIIVTSALSALSTAALAGAFDGPHVGFGAGMNNMNATTTLKDADDSTLGADLGKSRFASQVQGGYNFSLNKSFNLGLNGFYNLNDTSASASVRLKEVATINATAVLKKSWGFAVEPGIYLGDKTLAYGTLAYHRADLNFDLSVEAQGRKLEAGKSRNVSGFGYGAGIKHLVNKNVYVGVESQVVNYSSADLDGELLSATIEPKQVQTLVSVGYKF